MTKAKKLVLAGKAIRSALALVMIGYLAWDWWQRRNQSLAETWAAGTDSID